MDFAELVRKFEFTLKKSFNATMFNWACLMNDAYKNNPPNPHVHFHVRPRYNKKVDFEGAIFEDSDFAHHYNRDRKQEVPEKIILKIIKKIKRNL